MPSLALPKSGPLARTGLIAAAALLVLAGGLYAAASVRAAAEAGVRYLAALDAATSTLDAQRAALEMGRLLDRASPGGPGAAGRDDAIAADGQAVAAGLERLRERLAALRTAPSPELPAAELQRIGRAEAVIVARLQNVQRRSAAGDPAGEREPLREAAPALVQLDEALRELLAAQRAHIDEAGQVMRASDRRARVGVLAAGLVALALGLLVTLVAWRSLSTNAQLMLRLAQLAREDGLTGVANRRTLDERLPQEMARAQRQKSPLSVVMLDLDYFKRFNDRRGHAAGDALLRNAAQAWLRQLRPTDLLARYGGEEFTLVLPACDETQAEHLVERLQPLLPERQTFSAGVATWNGLDSPQELLAAADKALLQAKRGGRNRIVIAGREPQISLPLKLAS